MLPKRLLLIAFAVLALAQAQVDPPGRVAQLSNVTGSVSFQPGGVDEWVPASLNRPLTSGDRLWSDAESRAELHIGSATMQLASRTAFQFLNLDDRNAQVKLTEGTVTIHLRDLQQDDSFEVDTPNLAFALLRPGDYRIDADPDAATTVVTIREGQGEGTGRDQAFSVRAGEQARVTGEDTVGYDIQEAPPPDGWDRWCMSQIQRQEQSISARYVSRDVIGYQDLDQYGSWSDAPDYGPVWIPRGVPIGWAPYRYGHWAWIDPWGWTWVDDAPWGFAPFHYGRWAYYRNSWAWVPGPIAIRSAGPVVVRPVYSPALVAWVGGAHWGVSIAVGGGGPVGWVPLGPREVYVPAYHASPTYVQRVNTTNTVVNNVNVTNIYNTTNVTKINYVNQTAPNAVTAVPANAMATSRQVNQVATTVTPQQLASAQSLRAAPVAPQREGMLGRAVNPAQPVAQPPARAFQREVVARTTPPPAPVPFAQRQAAMERNPGQPLDANAMQQLRTTAPPARQQSVQVIRPVQPAAPVRQQPAASPAPAQAVAPTQPPAARESQPADPGWRRFDDRPPAARPNQAPVPAGRTQTPVAPAPDRPAPAPPVRETAPPVRQVQPEQRPAQASVPTARPPAAPSDRPAPAPAARESSPPLREVQPSRQDSVLVREPAPAVRQAPPARDATQSRPAPNYRNESGERTQHPQASQSERKAEPHEKPRGENK